MVTQLFILITSANSWQNKCCMKVVFFTHYESLYGANRSMLNLIEGLMQKKVEVLVVCAEEGAITARLGQLGVDYIFVPFHPGMNKRSTGRGAGNAIKLYRDNWWRLRKNLRASNTIYKKLKVWKPDILYSNSSVISVGVFLALFMRTPHVWHFRELAQLYFNFFFDYGSWCFNQLVRKSEAIVCISNTVKKHLIPESYSKSFVVYNGVLFQEEFDEFKKSFRTIENKCNYKFLIIGRLNEKKGQEVAVKALSIVVKKFPEAHLYIVGGGDRTKITHMVESYELEENVSFLGFVDNPFSAFKMADATLMCSNYEAMGRVTVESMAAMTPVIGYDAYGTSELIEHERTGLLYREGPEDLAQQMIKLINNPELANQLVINAWEEAREKYSIEHYTEQVYSVLKNIYEKKRISFH